MPQYFLGDRLIDAIGYAEALPGLPEGAKMENSP